jgi:hypothetical protein
MSMWTSHILRAFLEPLDPAYKNTGVQLKGKIVVYLRRKQGS